MKRSQRALFLSVMTGLSAMAISPLAAQTAPAPSTTGEEAVKLDPFNVQADSDVGFVAASALAGGRIATALKDTPVAYSVLTKEFLEAFNITDIAQAAQFSVSSNYYEGDGSDQGFARGSAQKVRIRGQVANAPTRNFFAFDTTSDSYNLDRIDFARGANAILFGSGAAGGTQNTVTKQPNTARPIRQLSAQIGSWNRFRFTTDVNQPLNDKMAVRVNALWATGDTWREHEWEDRVGLHLAGLYKLTPTLTVRGEFEYRKTMRLTGWTVHQDQLSAWDGRTTTSGFNAAMTAAQMARAGIARYPSQFVWRPEWGGRAINFQNQFQTTGAAYNATFANTNYMADQPIRTISFTLRNQPMLDVWNPSYRYAGAMLGAPGFQLPRREELALWDSDDRSHPTYTEIGRDVAAYVTWTPIKDLFVEFAADSNNAPRIGSNAGRRNLLRTMIDINRTLPTGEPNPHFLERFSDFLEYEQVQNPMYDNLRLQTAYVKETRWGKLQVGAMAGWQKSRIKNRTQFILLPLFSLAPDFRTFVLGSQSNEYALYTRIYHNEKDRNDLFPTSRPLTLINPVTGTSEIGAARMVYSLARTDQQYNQNRIGKFWQAAGNFDLFKNRLVLIGAFRRDFQDFHQIQTRVAGDMPAGWGGQDLIFLPDAPADYYGLTYTPKNAAGVVIGATVPAETRPRIPINGVQVPAPQYANDRFQDDYSPISVKTAVNTRTYGLVYNFTRWLGVYGNNSTTFALGAPQRNLVNRVNPPTASHGRDAGIRVTLPNGKLALSMGWYDAFQEGAGIRIIGGLAAAVNAIYASPIVGDLTTGATNIRGLKAVPGETWSTTTSTTTGYEMEVTANLTSAWRLTLNLATNDSRNENLYPDHPAYIANNDPILRQILADSGVIIGANNVATINPALNDPTKINVTVVQAAVDGWNSLQTTVIPNLIAARGPAIKTNQAVKLSGNLATDYRFSRGKLAGLRLGIAMNYRAGQIIGSRSGDTIVDPNNPNNAIDDPATDAYSYMYGSSYIKGTGTASYTYRLKEAGRFFPKTIQFDLAVDNLFRRHAPIAGFTNVTNEASSAGVILVPRNNDISNPSRMSVPGNVTYLAPMNWTLSAKMDF